MLYDQQCMDAIENPNMMVPWYLMAAYSYYEQDDPILSDGLFDALAKRMLECWNDIDHWHKDLITTEDLEAGTLLARDFPERVKGAVKHLRSNK
jgi:NAD-dependent DNA ligase